MQDLKGILDTKGVVLALIFGFLLIFFGGTNYLILMLWFFVLAIIVTRYEYETKKELGLYEHERSWENVFSNGLVPVILAYLSPQIGAMPFIASMAAVTADKFGSEIGVLDRENPISLLNFKEVKPGVSGAISKMGTVASLGAGALIGLGAIFLFGITPEKAVFVSLAGLGGSMIDTLFGFFEERGVGTKDTTNILGSIAGALLGLLIK